MDTLATVRAESRWTPRATGRDGTGRVGTGLVKGLTLPPISHPYPAKEVRKT
jgi:hypothetical protein